MIHEANGLFLFVTSQRNQFLLKQIRAVLGATIAWTLHATTCHLQSSRDGQAVECKACCSEALSFCHSKTHSEIIRIGLRHSESQRIHTWVLRRFLLFSQCAPQSTLIMALTKVLHSQNRKHEHELQNISEPRDFERYVPSSLAKFHHNTWAQRHYAVIYTRTTRAWLNDFQAGSKSSQSICLWRVNWDQMLLPLLMLPFLWKGLKKKRTLWRVHSGTGRSIKECYYTCKKSTGWLLGSCKIWLGLGSKFWPVVSLKKHWIHRFIHLFVSAHVSNCPVLPKMSRPAKTGSIDQSSSSLTEGTWSHGRMRAHGKSWKGISLATASGVACFDQDWPGFTICYSHYLILNSHGVGLKI